MLWRTPRELVSFLKNENIREALRRAAQRFADSRQRAIKRLGDFKEVRKKLKEIKELALEDADLLWRRIASSLEERGVVFLEAVDAGDARTKILDILMSSEAELLIKGKSITSEEIGLNPFLEANGIEVVETDLGERIVQLKREKPSHLIVPAIHNTKEEVASLFSRYFGEQIPPDPYVITKKVRKDLREKFLTAKAGLTGANVISSEPPAVFLMTNEGNGRLCATLPDVQITLTGWEKVVRTLGDALFLLRVLPKNSVGLDFSSYVSVFTGNFSWKKGRRFFFVLLDNGRRKAFRDPVLREALRCIRCGACMNVCPAYKVLSGQGFSHVYMGGIGVAWTAITAGTDAAKNVAELCLSCGSCLDVCPVEIPIPDIVAEIRHRIGKSNPLERESVRLVSKRKKFLAAAEVLRLARKSDESDFLSWARKNGALKADGEVNLFVGCLMDGLYPETARKAFRILSRFVDVALFEEECCGLPARVYGEKGEFHRLFLKNARIFGNGRKTVFICDSCFSTFLEYKKLNKTKDIEPISLAEFLLERGVSFRATERIKVLVHLPCHLRMWGRENALFELLKRVENGELIRDPFETMCCGGAGLYRYKLPEISEAVFDEKAERVRELVPDAIVTTCPSCLDQIKSQLGKRGLKGIKVLHLADFLHDFTECLDLGSIRFSDTARP